MNTDDTGFLCASVPLCLCASVPLCLCVFHSIIRIWYYVFARTYGNLMRMGENVQGRERGVVVTFPPLTGLPWDTFSVWERQDESW